MTCALCNINCSFPSFSKTICNFLRSVSTQNKFQMVQISRTPVHWTVSRSILLLHELSHGLENANENAQIKFILFFFYKIPCNSYLNASTLRLNSLQGFCSSQNANQILFILLVIMYLRHKEKLERIFRAYCSKVQI